MLAATAACVAFSPQFGKQITTSWPASTDYGRSVLFMQELSMQQPAEDEVGQSQRSCRAAGLVDQEDSASVDGTEAATEQDPLEDEHDVAEHPPQP